MALTLPTHRCLTLIALAAMLLTVTESSSRANLTLRMVDYAAAPITGATGAPGDPAQVVNDEYLARLNFMADEPGGGDRLFVNDLNGPLYLLDKNTRTFTEYLNFNGRGSQPGLFDRFYRNGGFATGLVTMQFDPDYLNNGKFYTIHIEEGDSGSQLPNTTNYPNLDVSNYGVTPSVPGPGDPSFQNVLVEWTDANIHNDTFEGTARELLRIDARTRIHPMGDIIFNPTAGPEDPDWRVMYVAIGDAGNGEHSQPSIRPTPQMLSAFGGKIIRIMPDNDGVNTPGTLSANGKYYIPDDNPFTHMTDSNVLHEIYALGLRNPHRMAWDVDPSNPANNHLLVNDIGLHTWEEVNIIHAGGNYGYPAREGNQRLRNNNSTGPLPSPDEIPVYITQTPTSDVMTPIYPVIQYGHGLEGQPEPIGDAISSGFVYRGKNIPSLYGRYVFGDITTGQLFWSDFEEMLAADDGNPHTLAEIHSIDLLWDNPYDEEGEQLYTLVTPGGAILGPLHQIAREGYLGRGGTLHKLPGGANATAPFGRADIRIQIDADGELYIFTKSDGMIRYLLEAVGDADFDGDGVVDGHDFLTWQRGLGLDGQTDNSQGDANSDGFVNHADLDMWQSQFGTVASNLTTSEMIPEPTGLGLALLGILLVTSCRTCNGRRSGMNQR